MGIRQTAATSVRGGKNVFERQAAYPEHQGHDQATGLTPAKALQEALRLWTCQELLLRRPISDDMLRKKALVYATKLRNRSGFAAKDDWIQKFKRNHDLGDTNASAQSFVEEFRRLIDTDEYDMNNIYNADEAGLALKSLPTKNQKEVEGSIEDLKYRVTVMACGNATGTHRIPLVVIGRIDTSADDPSFPEYYRYQPNACMNQEIFIDWYKNIFLEEIKKRKSYSNEKILLLLDNAPPHPSKKVLDSIDERCKVIFLPPNVTAEIQPMDQGVIKALKKDNKMLLFKKLLDKKKSDDCKTVTEILKDLTLQDCCEYIAEAWRLLSYKTLNDAWEKLLNTENNESAFMQLLEKDWPGQKFTNSQISNWLSEDSSYPAWHELDDDELLRLKEPTEN